MNPFKLDLRSLSLFRVCLGILLIFDLVVRFTMVSEFYADYGVLPRGPLLVDFANPLFFSIYYLAGKSFYIYLLTTIAGLCYTAFLFGYKARLFSVLSWLFFVSFTARAPIISHGGDDLIRLALFWIIFLPSSTYYSVDAALNSSKLAKPRELFNMPSVAFMGQLLLMYLFTAVIKNHPIWTQEGTALYYALELDQFLTSVGLYFRTLPTALLKSLTYVTFWTELFVPLLVFVPWKNSLFRWIAILTFSSFHFGLFLILKLGTFPWICIIYWFAFIPSSFWDILEKRFSRIQKATVIYYDAHCGYCLKMACLVKTFLILPFAEIRKAQDVVPLSNLMQTENSWIVQSSDQKTFLHFDAFIKLVQVSPFGFLASVFSFTPIKSLGNLFYQYQARRRQSFGVLTQGLHFKERHYGISLLTQGFVGVSFLVAIYWNIALLKDNDRWDLKPPIYKFGSVLRLHQQWIMFAPYPAFNDGWVVVDGTLFNGKAWDIFSDQAFKTERPEKMSDQFKNGFWRKYLVNLSQAEYSNHRLYFGRYLCRRWNDEHAGNDRVSTFKVYYMLEKSTPPDGPRPQIEAVQIWDHNCFAK